VVIRGDADESRNWAGQLDALYAPRQLVYAIPADAVNLPGALAERTAGDTTVAYICEGTRCSAPVTALDDLAARLSETERAAP